MMHGLLVQGKFVPVLIWIPRQEAMPRWAVQLSAVTRP